MKKLIFAKTFLVLVLTSSFISACQSDYQDDALIAGRVNTRVSPNVAKRVALYFLNAEKAGTANVQPSSNQAKANSLPEFGEKQIDSVISIPDEKGVPALYVTTFKPTGYVIVSATKKLTPILGYSENATFDDESQSPVLLAWLTMATHQVQALRASKVVIPNAIRNRWVAWNPAPSTEGGEHVKAIPLSHRGVGPLLQTHWGQHDGYNELLPNMGCLESYIFAYTDRPPTGCVATAVAQVMRYYKYPLRYDWDVMLSRIRYDSWDSPTLEVAKLMRDIGKAVHMHYTCRGSGSNLSEARNALIYTFGYSHSITHTTNFHLSDIISELDKRRPVILAGYDWDDKYRHAWVCDGYKVTHYKYIHNPGSPYYEYTTYDDGPHFFETNWGSNELSEHWFYYFKNVEGGVETDLKYPDDMDIIMGIKP